MQQSLECVRHTTTDNVPAGDENAGQFRSQHQLLAPFADVSVTVEHLYRSILSTCQNPIDISLFHLQGHKCHVAPKSRAAAEEDTQASVCGSGRNWRLRSTHAAPRLLKPVHALRKPASPAGRPSPSVHGRALTCQPRPPTSSRRSRVHAHERATARSLSGGGAEHALVACVRLAATVGVDR